VTNAPRYEYRKMRMTSSSRPSLNVKGPPIEKLL
jgi:hypothetical protein